MQKFFISLKLNFNTKHMKVARPADYIVTFGNCMLLQHHICTVLTQPFPHNANECHLVSPREVYQSRVWKMCERSRSSKYMMLQPDKRPYHSPSIPGSFKLCGFHGNTGDCYKHRGSSECRKGESWKAPTNSISKPRCRRGALQYYLSLLRTNGSPTLSTEWWISFNIQAVSWITVTTMTVPRTERKR